MKYEEYKKIRDAFNFLIVYGFDYEDISLIDNYLRSFNKEYGKASNEFWNCYS